MKEYQDLKNFNSIKELLDLESDAELVARCARKKMWSIDKAQCIFAAIMFLAIGVVIGFVIYWLFLPFNNKTGMHVIMGINAAIHLRLILQVFGLK
jgi:hypothetical protein